MENSTPNRLFTRKDVIQHSDAIAFGCSHTWGTGVEHNETWSYILNARNFGQGAASADFIARTAPDIIKSLRPTTVYVLWPEWSRFEITVQGKIRQSLPSDQDRIYFMESHNQAWCRENFKNQTNKFRDWCKNQQIRLVDITLYNLIPYIDHADRWPVSRLGHHYSPVWHQWVADIFKNTKENQELAYE